MTVSSFPPTVMPDLNPEDFTRRMLDLIPRTWSSDPARQPGGVLYSLFYSIATQKSVLLDQLVYALDSCRISTATDTALDAVAEDFFGSDLQRTPGQPDASFRNTIISTLLLSAATRPGMKLLLTRLVGVPPRMMEPWSVADTCSWDGLSYWDVDTIANPFRWGSPELRYQGFIETPKPSYALQGKNPVWAFDAGFCWDTPQCAYLDPDPSWFLSTKQLDALLSKSKAFGTTVWRKYVSQLFGEEQLGSTKAVDPGASSVTVTFFPPVQNGFSVVASSNWFTTITYTPIDGSSFLLTFGEEAPAGGGSVDWIVSPYVLPATAKAPVVAGQSDVTVSVPSGYETFVPFAQPSWNSTVYVIEQLEHSVKFGFGTVPPDRSTINYLFVLPESGSVETSGTVSVDEGAITKAITINARAPFEVLVCPSWNTTYEVTKTTTLLTISFMTPAPAGASVNWAFNDT